jgi:hypothetical protein
LRHKITQMKKQSFLLLAGTFLTITACNTTNDNQYSEAQIDSMVNARVDEMRLQMMTQNDSLINALAAQRADSIIAAMKLTSEAPTVHVPKAPIPHTGGTKPVPPPTHNTETPKPIGKIEVNEGTPTGKMDTKQTEGRPTGKRR